MPTVSVTREYFLKLLGREYSDEYLEYIMADYGIELDSIVDEPERHSSTPVATLKIDVCANRGDLLCAENIAKAIRCFLGLDLYNGVKRKASGFAVKVEKAVNTIRPFMLSAVVRGVKFTPNAYNSFIDHYDKLHYNVCRRRSLVAIGTHDLCKLDPSALVYTAKAPSNIYFVALNYTKAMNGAQLFDILRADRKLSEYLPLIEQAPEWPVIYDGRDQVLSLPPIINSEYSKIDLETRDVFIDVTATDIYRGKIALNALVCYLIEFGGAEGVETVEVIYEYPRKPLTCASYVYPDFVDREFDVSLDKVSRIAGVYIPADYCVANLRKMQVSAELRGEFIHCTVPFERADVLDEIDLIEDIMIGYGYYEIARYAEYPQTNTIGGVLPSFRVQNAVRQELSACGCVETLNFTLCPATDAAISSLEIELANAKTSTFTHVRSSLVPGMLRAASCAQFRPLPLRIFEVSEVLQKGGDIGVRTMPCCGAVFGGLTDMFGELHGVLDRIGLRLGREYTLYNITSGYEWLIDGRRAAIYCDGQCVGVIGVVQVETLKEYKIPFPISIFEMSI